MNRLPFFVDARDIPMLVIGGGAVAARKCRWLLRAGANVAVLSPVINQEISRMRDAGEVRHIAQRFALDYIPDRTFRLVVAATNDTEVNRSIRHWCDERGIWLNAVDDRQHSNAIFPAVVDRSPIQIAISSDGESPVLARQIRERIEAMLPVATGAIARAMGRLRDRLKRRLMSLDERRLIMERAARDAWNASEDALERIVDTAARSEKSDGRVLLVGAGPGDPDLLTLKALSALQTADVIVHDRLVSPAILDRARRDAEFIPVGKAPGGPCVTQEEINRIIVREALAGKLVCRLKGGDPGVFGRVGEEAATLTAEGIPFSIVPGITAAVAAAASAGVGLTHRDHAHALVFATGHGKDDAAMDELAELAGNRRTLAIYMGVRRMRAFVAAMLRRSMARTTPVLIVESASTSNERRLTTTLAELPAFAQSHGVQSPALIVVGEVAAAARVTGIDHEALPDQRMTGS